MTKATQRKWKRANRMMECAAMRVMPLCKCGSCKRTRGVGRPSESVRWALRQAGRMFWPTLDIWIPVASPALDGLSISELP